MDKKGDDLEIYFPCKYLIEILRATDDDVLKLSLTSPYMSMIIEGATPTEDGSSFLLSCTPCQNERLSNVS